MYIFKLCCTFCCSYLCYRNILIKLLPPPFKNVQMTRQPVFAILCAIYVISKWTVGLPSKTETTTSMTLSAANFYLNFMYLYSLPRKHNIQLTAIQYHQHRKGSLCIGLAYFCKNLLCCNKYIFECLSRS